MVLLALSGEAEVDPETFSVGFQYPLAKARSFTYSGWSFCTCEAMALNVKIASTSSSS
jgi:hypothetical protein